MSAPNETFAEHVQATSFSLSLGKTHVAALMHLSNGSEFWTRNHVANFPPALRGLERRGLAVRFAEPGENRAGRLVWELTSAGNLVCALLIEAGMFARKSAEVAA